MGRIPSRATPTQAVRLITAVLVLLSIFRATPAAASAQPGRWIWYASQSGWHHVYLDAMATGPHVIVYAQQGSVSSHDARVIANTFSWRVYPTDTRTFGHPPGMRTVSIALLPLGGITLGYFNEDDLAPYRRGADAAHSNHANILYVRTPATMPDSEATGDVGEVMAHELQHLIDFRIRVLGHGWSPEEDWLNEGLSVYAQFANHYFTERDALKLQAAAEDPGWRLTALNSSNASLVAHARTAYGRAGLFVSYLASRFGSSIARGLINSPLTGTSAVAAVLKARHASLSQVFADWGVASVVNQPGRYGYSDLLSDACVPPHPAVPLVSSQQLQFGYGHRLTMAAWSQQYVPMASGQPGTLTVRVRTPASHVRAAVVLQRPGDATATSVHWLRPDMTSNRLFIRIKNFGELYTRATVVLNDGSDTPNANAVQLNAHLIEVGNDNRVPRPAPPTRDHLGRTIGHISHT